MHSPITPFGAHIIYVTVLTPLFSIQNAIFFLSKVKSYQNEMLFHTENPASHPTGTNHLILNRLYTLTGNNSVGTSCKKTMRRDAVTEQMLSNEKMVETFYQVW